jgi:uncharacterized protein DUF6968
LDKAFVERRLELTTGGEIVVRLIQPEPVGNDWRCDYRITWPDRERHFHAFGIDGLQALILGLQMVHATLLASPEGKAGQLTWLGEPDLGLVAADPLRRTDSARRR